VVPGPVGLAGRRLERGRYARASAASEFGHPLRIELARGARIGVVGEVFAPGGGVQAAWLSGTELAVRLAGEMHP
jgi:renalase